jgi:hypothetical protein
MTPLVVILSDAKDLAWIIYASYSAECNARPARNERAQRIHGLTFHKVLPFESCTNYSTAV